MLIIFFLLNNENEPNKQKNGFKRSFVNSTVILVNTISTPTDIISISGITANTVFLSKTTTGEILFTDYKGTKKGKLKWRVGHPFYGINNISFVDSPYVYILAGDASTILKTSFNDSEVSEINIPKPIFSKGILINPELFVLRQFSKTVKDQKFVSYNSITGSLREESDISEVHNDGGIATDGMFNYDKKTDILIYTYFYKNSFLLLDTNLNRIGIGNTIDTFSSYQIHVTNITKGKSTYFTNNTPTRFINRASTVYNGKLYVYSTLKADNENADIFKKNMPIDVYDLLSLHYIGSLYLPKMNGKNCYSFKVCDNIIIALYPNEIGYFSIRATK